MAEKCTFCKSDIPKGTGKLFVRKTGKLLRFCSSKCEKNMLKLKRSPAKFKWSSKEKVRKAKK